MPNPSIRPTGQNLGQTPRPQPASAGVTRAPGQLQQGDVIQGEITDLHNKEIAVTTGDNIVIRGKIADDSMLSIGQTAAFRLSSISPAGILLEVIPKSYNQTELTIINKALLEAGLPATERNQAAVKALMDNLLPINKQSINHLMQQAYDYSTEDMNTLAVMNRNHMEITPDTVAQFSNYRNHQYQLLDKISDFAVKLPALLDTLAQNGPANAVADFGEKLLSITLSHSNETAPESPLLSSLTQEQQEQIRQMLSQASLSEQQLQALNDGTMTCREALALIHSGAKEGTLLLPQNVSSGILAGKMNEILMALEPSTPQEGLDGPGQFRALTPLEAASGEKEPAAPGTGTDSQAGPGNGDSVSSDPAQEASPDSSSRFALAGKLLHNISDAARSSFQNLNQMLASSGESGHTPEVIDSMIKALGDSNYARDTIAYLSPGERQQLLDSLKDFPVSNSMKQGIASGEASATEVFRVIRNLLPLAKAEHVQDLFRTPAFQNLFSHSLLSSLTITPKQLQSGDMDSFYRHMEEKMDSFENLINSSLSGNDSSQLSGEAHDMKSNIDFMKLLNETFAYLQLPLKLQHQNAHGDLYVYTSKEKRKQNNEKMSVLLHLDMEHLGSLDIRLEKDHNKIDAAFSLADKPSLQLIQNNTSLLEDSLMEKGYQCRVSVQAQDKPTDIVNDFLNTKITTGTPKEMKRFSFDIRA